MAFKIVWSAKAIKGYNDIIDYLETNWTDKEIRDFVNAADEVLNY